MAAYLQITLQVDDAYLSTELFTSDVVGGLSRT